MLLFHSNCAPKQDADPSTLFDRYYSKERAYIGKLLARMDSQLTNGGVFNDAEGARYHKCLTYYRDSMFAALADERIEHCGGSRYCELVKFYRALALIELQRHAEAEPDLARFCATPFFELNAEACWYYGLVLLKDPKKWDGAALVFSRLSQSQVSSHVADAKKILEILNKNTAAKWKPNYQ